jgi:PKD repeat protein
MINKIIAAFFISLSFLSPAFAQEAASPICGTDIARQQFFENHPELVNTVLKSEENFNEFAKNYSSANKLTPDTAIIPVVFHIIHNNGTENISDELIHEAMLQLNQDYSASNDDISDVIPEFENIIGDASIEFRLAQYDPDGNCTNGITRTVSELTYSGGDAIKDLINWPSDSYLNIWISKVAISESGSGGGLILGYATFPSMSQFDPDNDGLVVRADNVGEGYRVITHEAGHWLNLKHTWGNVEVETSCAFDDDCEDTPNTQGNYGGCNVDAISCGSLDNVQNFMDYAIPCYRMFTEDQASRMDAALNSSTADRNQLWSTANLNATGVLLDPILCTADFDADQVRICSGMEVEFTNRSYSGDTEWTWEFEGGDPATSNEENPIVVYNSPGLYEVTLTVSNGVDEESVTKAAFINVLPDVGFDTPLVEGFENESEFPNDKWVITSTDLNRYWEITSNASSSGSKSALLKNYYQTANDKDELESNPIDLSDMQDVVVTFKYAFAKRHEDDDDVLRVKVSRNCGNTWSTRETLRATDNTLVTAPNHLGYFTPESDEWNEAYIDNISELYLIENFRIKFEFIAGEGNNIYIDDINIFDPTTVGINEVNKDALNFSVYPNPVKDQVNVQFNLLHNTDVMGEVFDISGRKITTLFDASYSVGKNQLNFDTSDWNAGVYLVKISLEGESFVEKVIKH